ncbi:MAG: cytochrome c biogenesis protein CcsA, partial [Candidatus Zixiibacteriota bacterium]
MTAELAGDLAVFLAFIMALVSGAAFFITALGKKNLFYLGVRAYILQIFFTAAASVYLFYLIFSHDFTVNYVYQYSSSDLPLFYLLSSFWAGQEGTYLLWLLFSSLFGLILVYRGRRYTTWAMAFYSLINLFFAVILLSLSPFRPLSFSATEGAGLNPLLQDPWMVIHPPMMFLAYAAAGIPFVLALAAMARRDFSEWLKITFPYVGLTSLALLAANVMGGYWAYKTLGWGGYWAWDPVENTSFVPWVISLSLIHGMLVEKRTGALRRSNLLLSCALFFLVVYGTFLTRSGVLADFSVHSFVDLGINAFLIFFMLLYLGVVLTVYFTSRSPEKEGKPMNYNVFSQSFMLFAGMMLLLILGVVVLFWSSLPLITRYVTDNPTSPDIATYNAFAFPLAILVSLFLTLTPFVVGAGEKDSRLKARAVIFAVIALVIAGGLLGGKVATVPIAVTVLIYVAVMLVYLSNRRLTFRVLLALTAGIAGVIAGLLFSVRSFEFLFFIGAALAAATAHIESIVRYLSKHPNLVGGHLSHFGVGLMLIGIILSSAFPFNEKVVLPRDQKKTVLQ